MVNSSWTAGHIQQLWWRLRAPALVYPPCDTTDLQRLPLDRKLKHLFLVSVAQFRPEKNHRLQLEAYALARQRAGVFGAACVRACVHAAGRGMGVWARAWALAPAPAERCSSAAACGCPAPAPSTPRDAPERASSPHSPVLASSLKMVGSCRGADDEARLAALQAYAEELGLSECVKWHVNVPYGELKQLLGGAVGGLHTMLDEHFGISVVEYMAAGAEWWACAGGAVAQTGAPARAGAADAGRAC
jgi:alpha-1,2-mannosyltransferase